MVEAASGKRLADFLDERLFKPLGMNDTGFSLPQDKIGRLAQAFATDPASRQPNKLIDVAARPGNDSGGAGAVSTAADYLRFAQMLLNGGQLDGVRMLSRKTIELMASDHLGTRIQRRSRRASCCSARRATPSASASRCGRARVLPACRARPGEFMWAGYAGTFFWVDPKEELTAVLMTQAPSPIRAFYRRLFKQLVYQAIAD